MESTKRWTMVAAILGSGIVFLDGTIVNVALPAIGRELPSSVFGVLEGQAYIVSGYLAVLAALLIIAGALADYYGRRLIFGIGLAGFGVTSLLCGVAPNLELLVLFRVLQGAAGALLVPGSLSIITATFDGPARARAFGIWAAATSGLVVLGPVLGGLLVDSLSWRIAFLINVPLVALALFATIRYMKESKDSDASGRFDWLGAIVGAIAIGGLAFGAIRGQERAWSDNLAWVSLGVGAVATIAFPFLMRRRDPLVPLSLFAIRDFAVINLSTFLIYGALYVSQVYQTLLLQGTLGYTAFAAGIAGLPVGLCLVFLSTRIGTLAGRFGARPFLVAGPVLMGLSQLWLARVPADSAPWQAALAEPATLVPPLSFAIDFLPSLLLFGVGIAFVVAPLTSTLMSSIPTRNAGLGSAINNALSRVGQPLLGALIFIVVSATFYAALGSRLGGIDTNDPGLRAQISPLNPPKEGTTDEQVAAATESSVDAFRLASVISGGLLFGGAVVNLVGLSSERPGRRERGSETSEAPVPG
jgi:EmrB/QacA subfamily drug resistance transporter